MHQFLGPPIEETLQTLTGLPFDGPEVRALRDAYRARYREEGLVLTTVFPGVPEALDALRARGHVLALATSKPRPIAEAVVEATGLRLDHVGAADPDAVAEPKAVTIGRVLGALGRRDATMVGDRRHDVEGARAHGLRVVGVAWWRNPHEAELRPADAIARSPLELPRLVQPA